MALRCAVRPVRCGGHRCVADRRQRIRDACAAVEQHVAHRLGIRRQDVHQRQFRGGAEPHPMGRPVCHSADAHQSFLGGHADISGGDVHRRGDRAFQSVDSIRGDSAKRPELPQSRRRQSDEFHAVRRAMDHSDCGRGIRGFRGAVRLPEPPRRASRQTVSRLRQAIPFRERDRKTAADPASRPVLHAVFDAGEHRRLVGQRLRHRHGGQALHVGLRIRRPAQRAAGGVHPSAQPESHGQAGRLFRRDHEAGRGPL